jgi:hypothetical protein
MYSTLSSLVCGIVLWLYSNRAICIGLFELAVLSMQGVLVYVGREDDWLIPFLL